MFDLPSNHKSKKKSHLSRHFEIQHAIQITNKYPIGSELRTEYIRLLQSQINKEKSFLKAALSDGECVTLASFKISMIIAKHQKPFTDGEFVLDGEKISFSLFGPLEGLRPKFLGQ